MEMRAARQRQERIGRGVDPARPVRYRIARIVIQPHRLQIERADQRQAFLRVVDQIVLAIARILEPDDHAEGGRTPRERCDIGMEPRRVGTKRGIGVDHPRAERGSKFHPSGEDRDRIAPPEIDMGGKRVAAEPACLQPASILASLGIAEHRLVERFGIADDERRLDEADTARRHAVAQYRKRMAVIGRRRDRDRALRVSRGDHRKPVENQGTAAISSRLATSTPR